MKKLNFVEINEKIIQHGNDNKSHLLVNMNGLVLNLSGIKVKIVPMMFIHLKMFNRK